MIDWGNFSVFLEKRLALQDVELFKTLLSSLSFTERQNLMWAMIAFPGKIPFFIEIVKKKKALAERYDEHLAKEILELEKEEFISAMEQHNN